MGYYIQECKKEDIVIHRLEEIMGIPVYLSAYWLVSGSMAHLNCELKSHYHTYSKYNRH